MCVPSSQFIRWSLWVSGGKSNTARTSVAISFTCAAAWPHAVPLLALTVSGAKEKHVHVIPTYLCFSACKSVCVCVGVLSATKQGHLSRCIAIQNKLLQFEWTDWIALQVCMHEQRRKKQKERGNGSIRCFLAHSTARLWEISEWWLDLKSSICTSFCLLFLKVRGWNWKLHLPASIMGRCSVCCGYSASTHSHMHIHSDALKCPSNTLLENGILNNVFVFIRFFAVIITSGTADKNQPVWHIYLSGSNTRHKHFQTNRFL